MARASHQRLVCTVWKLPYKEKQSQRYGMSRAQVEKEKVNSQQGRIRSVGQPPSAARYMYQSRGGRLQDPRVREPRFLSSQTTIESPKEYIFPIFCLGPRHVDDTACLQQFCRSYCTIQIIYPQTTINITPPKKIFLARVFKTVRFGNGTVGRKRMIDLVLYRARLQTSQSRSLKVHKTGGRPGYRRRLNDLPDGKNDGR
ncbi:hypothetical protein QBC36DRAFT_38531 [Triangularia setosa]|uniref:Uncharacterized protein n=1 Tax=Triangularia setosa TaxID=2587417 RepID=A0AAN7A5Z1_9PEZI|nr:hypothetical protein QBC36DRAFT_38531 [Podospora setosa]